MKEAAAPAEEEEKSQLVNQICSLSSLSISCPHTDHLLRHSSHGFIDWYRLLGVEENADVDLMRRRYHRLALQLHPDKNKHPRAETAFKLVLQAYSILCDNVRRRDFNVERSKCFCIECDRIPYTTTFVTLSSSAENQRSRSFRIRQALKDIRERFKEEAKVMENCRKFNAAAASSATRELPVFNPSSSSNRLFQRDSSSCSRSRRESPIFNPSDYGGVESYPHLRSFKKPENFQNLQRKYTYHGQRSRTFECPIFENRIDRGILTSKPASVR
ncbi:Chaperone protein dnaJ 49, partial [Linum perenne]